MSSSSPSQLTECHFCSEVTQTLFIIETESPMRTLVRYVPLLLVAVVMAFAGYLYGHRAGYRDAERYQSYGPPFNRNTYDMAETINLIRSRHVGKPVTDDELYYGAIRGMIEALKEDPYSHFLDPGAARRNDEDMAGNFAGIGVEIDRKDGRPVVVTPIDGSPAAQAGIAAGDVIMTVDGQNTFGLQPSEVVSKIRGAKGTPVTITVAREGADGAKEYRIVRDTITVKSVRWKVLRAPRGTPLLHVTVTGFHEDTGDLFKQATEAGLDAGVSGVILDLRNDPGGYLAAAEAVSCAWISRQPYVVVERVNGRREQYRCRSRAPLSGMPTVVLINKGSASASEITAGALQDLAHARVIGEKSYGKGCGQDVIGFPDGAKLALTAFLWFTPNGRTINGTGIAPDETVINDPDDLTKGKDAQLQRAIDYLSGAR